MKQLKLDSTEISEIVNLSISMHNLKEANKIEKNEEETKS